MIKQMKSRATSTGAPDNSSPQPVSFWQAFIFWLKLGFISFGGPAGQISIMHQSVVSVLSFNLFIVERRTLSL